MASMGSHTSETLLLVTNNTLNIVWRRSRS
jgi:hypothetical protein